MEFATTVDRDLSRNFFEFQSNGILAMIQPTKEDISIPTEKAIYEAKNGDLVCALHFTVTGFPDLVEGTEFKTLRMGLKGVDELLKRIYEPNSFPESERLPYNISLIYGVTNNRMAEVSQRMGFSTAITNKDVEGNSLEEGEVLVVAKVQDLKKSFEEHKKRIKKLK
jgi:hypothetical protein